MGGLAASGIASAGHSQLAPTSRPGRGSCKAKIIDVHTHPIVPAWRSAIAKATGQSPDDLKMYQAPVPQWTAARHIENMDKHGITGSVLSIPLVANLATGSQAKTLVRKINEEMANAVSEYPGRLGAFGVLPLDNIDAALEETAYMLDVLKFEGIGIGTNYAGHYLGDPYFDPLLSELNRRTTVLFAHSSTPPGYKPDSTALDPSMIEIMFDTTRMLLNMVLSGAKRRFSDLKIISTHGGGTMPYLAGRVSVIEPLIGAGAGRATMAGRDILADLATFYFDLTAATFPGSLDAIRRLVPVSRLLFGSDWPMMPADEIPPALKNLNSYDNFSNEMRVDILAKNAVDLLPGLGGRICSVS